MLSAGDTWQWTRSLADYPPGTGWTLSYAIAGASVIAAGDIVVSESGSVYSVSVDALKTAAVKPGSYRWAAYVTKDGARFTVDSGIFRVDRDLAGAGDGDAQAHAERMIAAIEAVLEGRIPADVNQYQIAGRALTKIPIPELRSLLGSLRHQVWRMRNGNRLGPTVKVTFGRPS